MIADWGLWEWILAAACALIIGISKTGLAGLGMLAIVMFANLMPAKLSSGFVLPMLIMGDCVAVAAYRREAQWGMLLRLFPWTGLGVLCGYFAMGRFSDREAGFFIGAIILVFIAVHVWRQRRAAQQRAARPAAGEGREGGTTGEAAEPEHGLWFVATFGIMAGFTTLVANAAGPIMAIYLLAMRLPKMQFMGTAAYFYLLMNCFKVPFMIDLGLINWASAKGNLLLAPAVLIGTVIGRAILHRINQRLFENIALLLSVAAGLNLLYRSWSG
ncbi:hypothetical protein AXK11_07920 [Cephaloticoccus primus]|uniref:Probable membrane transporter protein n=1 Tax=Cephaloticoccus primus TaxID=1548207 RepID=A0A139SJB9_9BACT|nr:sulfite exporter TauE/SafE family protein [Cephaloticoccus primus]KXU34649.1 hypothetical protein AXK11_07920 [Cephaloticoccus primus]